MVVDGRTFIYFEEGYDEKNELGILKLGIEIMALHSNNLHITTESASQRQAYGNKNLPKTSIRQQKPYLLPQPFNVGLPLGHFISIPSGNLAVDLIQLRLQGGSLGILGLTLLDGYLETFGCHIPVPMSDVLVSAEGVDGIVQLVDDAVCSAGGWSRVGGVDAVAGMVVVLVRHIEILWLRMLLLTADGTD